MSAPAPERDRESAVRVGATARAIDWLFRGTTSPWTYVALRVGLSALLLIRQSDWLRPFAKLEHHRFVHGLDFAWSYPEPPYLSSPLSFGVALGEGPTNLLVHARTGLAVLLLLGVRSQMAAAALAFVAYLLFASDRYHYYHHLHLLFVATAWLSFCPLDERLSLERWMRGVLARRRGKSLAIHGTSPLWPLQLVRAFTLSVYVASGLAKLNGEWLSGEVLHELHDLNAVGGATFDVLSQTFGYRGVAVLTCIAELALPVLLVVALTRRGAVLMAWGFHVFVGSSIDVFTFGAQMAVLLLSFLPEQGPRMGPLSTARVAPRSGREDDRGHGG